MAGSYGHVTKDDGSLASSKRVQSMLECVSGDVFEAVEEMYGMIWYLAAIIEEDEQQSMGGDARSMSHWIEVARSRYKEGLTLSPTKRYK